MSTFAGRLQGTREQRRPGGGSGRGGGGNSLSQKVEGKAPIYHNSLLKPARAAEREASSSVRVCLAVTLLLKVLFTHVPLARASGR